MCRKESNIRKRKDGRWEARYVSGKNQKGKSKYTSIYGKTYQEVKEKRLRCMKDLNLIQKKNSKVLFQTICTEWLEICEKSVKESTYAKYQYIVKHYLLDTFSSYYIDEITTDEVSKYLFGLMKTNSHLDGLENNTVKVILSTLKLIFKYAKQKQINIKCQLDYIHIKNNDIEPRYLSLQEQTLLEKKLNSGHEGFQVGIWLGLLTGMRIGEICALKWEDISFEDQIISVNKTIQRIPNYDKDCKRKTKIIIDVPKSKNSMRQIPFANYALQIIKTYQPEDSNTYVLTNTKHYMEPRCLEYHFSKLVDECGLENVHFHTLRHTFTTRCIESGFDLKTLSEILGHSSISFTLNRYAHSSLDLKIANMNKLKPIYGQLNGTV